MPNTTIGSFYSDGLGKVIQKRLKAAHQDITRLQSRHGELARVASITGELVTADQSLASDNITLALVKAIAPDRWFEELNRGRIDKVRLPSGLEVNTPTFCTMGIGFTFPLQTLVFYVLLKAINEVYCHGRSLVSVYGDDLIYAKSMHPFVVLAFSRLGLRLNLDKTFADGCFRESCGSDFFAGVDVRPFLPRNEAGSSLTRNAYEALLYTWFNGLHRRWTRYECPAAFALLLGELDEVTRGILRVPEDFPDSSGIRCSSPYDTLDFPCRLTPVKFGKHGKVSFKYLRFQSDLQEENRHAPYLWRTLGDKCLGSDSFHDHHLHLSLFGDRGASAVVQRIEHITGVSRVSTPTIRNGVVGSANTRHSSRRGSKHPAVPCITQPGGAGRLLRQTGVSVHWTPKM